MKRYSFRLIFLTIAFMPYIAFSQKQSDLDRLYWSDRERIAVADFGIQTQDTKSGLSSAAFSLEYNIHGMNFMTKNFNKKVTHFMVRSASQIALDGNEAQYIRYQQTLFDLEEIYVRQFRKALRENRKKLFLKTAVADELKDQLIGIDLPSRQAKYNNETNRGKDLTKQKEWEKQIRKELDELGDFAFDK